MNIRQIEQRWKENDAELRMLHGLRVVRDTDPAMSLVLNRGGRGVRSPADGIGRRTPG